MRASSSRIGWLSLFAGVLTAVLVQGHAIESAALSLGDIRGEGWEVSSVSLQVGWQAGGKARVKLQADTAVLPEQFGTVSDLSLVCEDADLDAAGLDCGAGTLKLRSSRFGRQNMPVAVHYRHPDQSVQVRIRGLRLAAGRLAATVHYQDGKWRADVAGKGVQLAQLHRELARLGVSMPPLDVQGSMAFDLRLSGEQGILQRLSYDTRLAVESFSDDTGRYAGENLSTRLTGKLSPRKGGWQVDFRLVAERGALYVEPVYIEVGDEALSASARFDWHAGRQQVTVHAFEYRHPGNIHLSGEGQLRLAQELPLHRAEVQLHDAVLPAAYTAYLQPWFNGSLAGNLATSGHLSGAFSIERGLPVRAGVQLTDMSVLEQSGLFGFNGLQGELDWSDSADPEYSTLGWSQGQIYQVALGRASFEIESTRNAVRFVRPARIPVLDGALDIDSFALDYRQQQGLRWSVDSVLTPVSMLQLTRAIEWPEFGGKLSGVIPNVRYENGELSVGGVLLVRVFDGVITLRDLQLTDPLGLVPRLYVNASVDNIDLESLTGAFSFGRIEGRLDGRVDDLRLESWLPVAFDAEIRTPPGDRSRRRISQKAVDNISDIGGGGVGGALSRSFLRMFEDFPYASLGIRCRLQNGICDMGGVEPAENGYYLVKGSFLPPRLDVIGFADRVDWDTLVAQIVAVTRDKSGTGE